MRKLRENRKLKESEMPRKDRESLVERRRKANRENVKNIVNEKSWTKIAKTNHETPKAIKQDKRLERLLIKLQEPCQTPQERKN